MFDKLSYTWEIMGESWRVLKQDKEMLLLREQWESRE